MAEFTSWVTTAGEAVAAREWPDAAQLLRAALELWCGPALAGVEAAFAQPVRVRLDEQRLAAIEQLAEVELCLGRHHMLVAELTEHVHAHPFRERLRGLLMLALYRSGRRPDALASARDLRRRLADEQGLDPGETISTLETMILREDPDLDLMFSSGQPDTTSVAARPSSTADPGAATDAGRVRPNRVAIGEVGLAAARRLGDQVAEVRMYESICGAYLQAGRLADCAEMATRAAGLAAALGDATTVARSHHLRGIAHDRLGQWELAEYHLHAALAEPAYATSPDAVLGYLSIGAIHGGQGRYDDARGNEILADCLANDDPPAAARAWCRAIEIYEEVDPELAEPSRQRLAHSTPTSV